MGKSSDGIQPLSRIRSVNMIDKEKVKAVANPEDVANALGLQVKKVGRTRQILCPGHLTRLGHEDKHIGNAFLTRKGYHCCGCNVTVDVFGMVQECIPKLDFTEAVKFVADIYGISDEDSSRPQITIKRIPSLPPEDYLKKIGLGNSRKEPSYVIKASVSWEDYCKRREDEDHIRVPNENDDEDYFIIEYVSDSLGRLLREDPKTYKWLLFHKTQEYVDNLKEIRNACIASGDDEDAEEILQEIESVKSDFYRYTEEKPLNYHRKKKGKASKAS